MMLQHRYEQALALAERSVSLHEAHGSGHGLAVALATLGQICVRLGDLGRAEDALHRALDVRSPIQFHETTGAVFDTLAQIHLIRGRYDTASEFLARGQRRLRRVRAADQSMVRVVGARPGRASGSPPQGDLERAVAQADEIRQAGAPPLDALQATLLARRSADRREPARRGAPAACVGRRRARPESGAGRMGRISAAARRSQRQRRQRRGRVPRLRAERDAARTPRRTVPVGAQSTSRSAAWSPKPARGPSPSAICARPRRSSQQLGAERDVEDTHQA